MKRTYNCGYCNHSSIRKWNLKVHINRKHPNMTNYLHFENNGNANSSREFQNNTTHHLFSDSFEGFIKNNPLCFEEFLQYREIVEKIEHMSDDALFLILMWTMHFIDRRNRIQKYSQSL